MNEQPNWDDLPSVLTVNETMNVMRLSRNSIYEAIQRGEIPHLKFGRRILIPKHGLMLKLGVPNEPKSVGETPRAATPSPAASRNQPPPAAKYLALPTLKPIPIDRFEPAFAASLVCGAEMPDGSLWLMDEDGSQITVGTDGAEIAQSLIRVVVRRKAQLKPTRRSW